MDLAQQQRHLNETPAPDGCPAGMLRLQIAEVGICGTDFHLAEEGEAPEGRTWLIEGHEGLGKVIAVGDGVTNWHVGDWVVPIVREPCPHDWCLPCRHDRQDSCVSGDYTEHGIHKADGFMADEVLVSAKWCVPVPQGALPVAVLTEPTSIVEKAWRQIDDIQTRLPHWQKAPKQALVLGAGPIGFLAALTAQARGYEVRLYSKANEQKQQLAKALGIPFITAEEVPVEHLAEHLNQHQIHNTTAGAMDVVIEATGSPEVTFDSFDTLAPNGVYMVTGLAEGCNAKRLCIGTLMDRWVMHNQVVAGTVNAARQDYESALAFLDAHHQRAAQLISQRVPADAFEQAFDPDADAIKRVLVFHPLA